MKPALLFKLREISLSLQRGHHVMPMHRIYPWSLNHQAMSIVFVLFHDLVAYFWPNTVVTLNQAFLLPLEYLVTDPIYFLLINPNFILNFLYEHNF